MACFVLQLGNARYVIYFLFLCQKAT